LQSNLHVSTDVLKGAQVGREEGGTLKRRRLLELCFLQAHDAWFGQGKICPDNVAFGGITKPTNVPGSNTEGNTTIHVGTNGNTMATKQKKTTAATTMA
jgi:hypothetical protein